MLINLHFVIVFGKILKFVNLLELLLRRSFLLSLFNFTMRTEKKNPNWMEKSAVMMTKVFSLWLRRFKFCILIKIDLRQQVNSVQTLIVTINIIFILLIKWMGDYLCSMAWSCLYSVLSLCLSLANSSFYIVLNKTFSVIIINIFYVCKL